ncbi:hypothetical protein BKA62DRAFT_685952 [Auriculariales sp. MPI-PUGE-AT-0066]|nr:hypothetical protein BKA62DRAFT_685952 [Auriculariales sp. MPI-PUGE-AT-0066]
MHITLPPFRTAFPESLMRREPAVPSQSGPALAQCPPSARPRRSSTHASLTPLPWLRTAPNSTSSPAVPSIPSSASSTASVSSCQSPVSHFSTLSASPSPTLSPRRSATPLICPAPSCNRTYSCLGNLNRHRKLAHGASVPTRSKTISPDPSR